eukprot:scaffold282_cov129-Skeletonema_menzelii.AAC.8
MLALHLQGLLRRNTGVSSFLCPVGERYEYAKYLLSKQRLQRSWSCVPKLLIEARWRRFFPRGYDR